jgi:flagellar secretion chaperone FliS
MSSWNPQGEYLAHRVTAASPLELIRILYEAAVQAVDQALEGLRSGDILLRGNSVTKAIEILSELRVSLRREVNPEYCDTLSGLYSYLQRQLIRAHAEKSESLFQEAARLLRTLLDGWTGAMENLNTGPDEGRTAEPDKAATGLSSSGPYSQDPVEKKTPGRSWHF